MKMRNLAILAVLALPAAAQESTFANYFDALWGAGRSTAGQEGVRARSGGNGSGAAWSSYYESGKNYYESGSNYYHGLLREYRGAARSALAEVGLEQWTQPESVWEMPSALPQGAADRETLIVPVVPRRGVSGSSTRVGPFLYHQFDGISGTTTRVGNFFYHDFSNGLSGTSTKVGRFVYHDFNNGVSGTSSQVGSFTYHDFSNGVSGTSSKVGSFTYHDFNNGVSCVSSTVGSTVYTDCY